MGADERFLFIFLKTAPCSCRCRHCDFAVSGTFAALPLERAVAFVEPFVQLRDTLQAPYANIAVFLGDGPLNYPDLAGGVHYLREHAIEGWYSLAANGFRLRSLTHWRPYLEGIREAGTEILEFTLYGQRETHDWFARRPRDYAAIAELARFWREEIGGKTSWSLFVHKANLHELDDLRAEIWEEHGGRWRARLWGYLGFAADQAQEDLRLDEADLTGLDAGLRAELGDVRPERAWTSDLGGSDESPYPEQPRVMHLTIDRDGWASIPYKGGVRLGHTGALRIGRFPVESAEDFLGEWKRAYDGWRSAYPLLRVLSARYGDPSGRKLYSRDSIIDKWSSRWDAAHSSATGRLAPRIGA